MLKYKVKVLSFILLSCNNFHKIFILLYSYVQLLYYNLQESISLF